MLICAVSKVKLLRVSRDSIAVGRASEDRVAFLGGHKAGETAWKSLSWEEAVPRDFFCRTGIQLLAAPACAVWDPQEGL